MGTGVFQLGQQPLIVYDSANAQPAIYRPSCRSHDTMTSMARTGPGPISGALFVGDCGIGTLTIGNGGMVNVGFSVGVAVFPGSTGTVNVGAASGQPAAAPDTLNTSLADRGRHRPHRLQPRRLELHLCSDPFGPGSGEVDADFKIPTAKNTDTRTTAISGGALIVNGLIASSALR